MVKLFKKSKNYPRHIAIILDGNRRWAKEHKKLFWQGHKIGFEKIKKFFEWSFLDLNIKELTLYCFSAQNFQRSGLEVKIMMNFFLKKFFLDSVRDLRFHKHNVRVCFWGHLHLLPQKAQKVMREFEQATKNYKSRLVNFCVAYGGQEEIVDTVNKIYKKMKNGSIKNKEFSKELIEKNLYIKSTPDIIIRTSGEQRTSNFLCWQQAYSEWFFIKKYWPDFTKADLVKIIKEYQQRARRFGK